MLVDYYRPEFTRQLIVYAAILLGMFILASIPRLEGMHFLEKFVIATLIALGPLPFSSEKSPIANAMLPATSAEKYTLTLIYSFIVIPIFLVGLWQILYLCTSWSGYTYSYFGMTDSDFNPAMLGGSLNTNLAWVFSVLTDAAPICSVLLVTLSARNSVMVKSLLAYIGTLMTYFFCGAIIGIVMTYNTIKNLDSSTAQISEEQVSQIVMPLINTLLYIIGAITILYIAFTLWRSYRLISRRQY